MTRPAPDNKVAALKQTLVGLQRRNGRLVEENKRLRRELAVAAPTPPPENQQLPPRRNGGMTR